MSGRCSSCATSFSFFKKELGCKNCGCSFCKDCLKKKAPIPKLKNETHKVCNRCYDILTGKAKPEDRREYSPPEAYKKRMAALEDGSQPTGGPRGGVKSAPQKRYPTHMKKEDIEIQERLERLKESHKVEAPSQTEIETRMKKLKEPVVPVPSEAEVRQRLDRLNQQHSAPPGGGGTDNIPADQASVGGRGQGRQPTVTATGRTLPKDEVHHLVGRVTELVNIDNKYASTSEEEDVPPEDFTHQKHGKDPAAQEEEEVAKLIKQASKEAKFARKHLEDGRKKDVKLRERLDKLTGKQPGAGAVLPPGWSDEKEAESEDVAAERALKAILKDDFKSGGVATADEDDDADAAARIIQEIEDAPDSDPEDQLPWCCICNNDATLRCYGCDGDLYCNRCFKEGHSRQDYRDHKTKKFVPSTTSPDVS